MAQQFVVVNLKKLLVVVISSFVNQKTNSVNDLVTQQQKINKVIKNTSGPIKDVMTNLQNITTQLKDVFANFQSKIN